MARAYAADRRRLRLYCTHRARAHLRLDHLSAATIELLRPSFRCRARQTLAFRTATPLPLAASKWSPPSTSSTRTPATRCSFRTATPRTSAKTSSSATVLRRRIRGHGLRLPRIRHQQRQADRSGSLRRRHGRLRLPNATVTQCPPTASSPWDVRSVAAPPSISRPATGGRTGRRSAIPLGLPCSPECSSCHGINSITPAIFERCTCRC